MCYIGISKGEKKALYVYAVVCFFWNSPTWTERGCKREAWNATRCSARVVKVTLWWRRFSACEWGTLRWSFLMLQRLPSLCTHTHAHTLIYILTSKLDNGTTDLFPWLPSLTNQKAPFIPASVTWLGRLFVWSLPSPPYLPTHTHTDRGPGNFSGWLAPWSVAPEAPIIVCRDHSEGSSCQTISNFSPHSLLLLKRCTLMFFCITNCYVFENKTHLLCCLWISRAGCSFQHRFMVLREGLWLIFWLKIKKVESFFVSLTSFCILQEVIF